MNQQQNSNMNIQWDEGETSSQIMLTKVQNGVKHTIPNNLIQGALSEINRRAITAQQNKINRNLK